MLACSIVLYVVNSLGLLKFWTSLGSVSVNMVYFAVAVAFGERIIDFLSKARPGSLLLIIAAAAVVHTCLVPIHIVDVRGMRPLATAGGIAVVACLSVLLANIGAAKFLPYLGVLSLQIYVAHGLAAQFTRVVLQYSLHVTAFWPHLLLGVVTGLAFPIALHLISRKLGISYIFFLRKNPPEKR